MQSRNIFLYHSTICSVAGELIRTVLPSRSTSIPPKDQSTGPAVGDVHELGLVQPGEVHAHLDQVVAGLALDLGGVLGRLLGVGDVVDADLDPGVLREALADLGELLVGGRGEVVPAEV